MKKKELKVMQKIVTEKSQNKFKVEALKLS